MKDKIILFILISIVLVLGVLVYSAIKIEDIHRNVSILSNIDGACILDN